VPRKYSLDTDAVGWIFWLIVFAVLLGPGIWVSWKVVYRSVSPLYPVGMGAVSAALGSGLVSWAVNAVIQTRQKKRRIAEKKKARRKK